MLARPRWAALSGGRDRATLGSFGPAEYTDLLAPLGYVVNAWETTYLHLLPNPPQGGSAVLEWVKGTALRPVLAQLSAPKTTDFLAEYGQELLRAYPARSYGTPLAFRRIFVVAHRS